MSAWHVLSTLGFYQLNPANGNFIFGSPSINQATIALGGGKTFAIEAKNNSTANKYIQRVTLNGKPYSKSYLRYQDLQQGGKLVIEMGPKPSATWGVAPQDRPRSVMN
jgi:putative alpha-1,2-mannosidase